MLEEQTLFGIENKTDIAIKRLKMFEPKEGYYLAFSGGKDSVVIKELAKMAGVKHDSHYSVTTIDPPELIYFIRDFHQDVIWDKPDKPFLTALTINGWPQRQSRWCCEKYKENGGNNRRVITGVRKSESNGRKHRPIYHQCHGGGYKSKNKDFVNPIVDWSDSEVWDFIKGRKLPYCKLYDEGWHRIGCLFCPMNSQRKMHAERYPGYKRAFIRAFDKLLENRRAKGIPLDRYGMTGEEVFEWWLDDKKKPGDKDQLMMFEQGDE